MRPETRLFLDSGDPAETQQIKDLLGFLDGQTTNPTLVSRHPLAKERFEKGQKFTEAEIFDFYKQVVQEISAIIPDGSVSIEVYADKSTAAEAMLAQGKDMFAWIPNAHIKYPTTTAGLTAAERSIQEDIRINMTLCFSQEQAAAVYAATKGAQKGNAFVSPFIGRLDDTSENGMDLVDNIIRMYDNGDGHVDVLAASVRNIDQFMQCLALEADIITAPFSILKQWGEAGKPMPGKNFKYDAPTLKPIPYTDINLEQPWSSYDISHPLTSKGIDRFSTDWNQLITSWL